MQLLVITTPPDVQLGCLSIDVTEQQNLMLVATATRDDSCYMELPTKSAGSDRSSSRYGRVFHETGQWFLESFLVGQFTVNEHEDSLEMNRAQPLSDGDLIECHGYTLMFSDFSPWKTMVRDEPVLRADVPSETNVFSVLDPEAQSDPDQVNDPFEWLDQRTDADEKTVVDIAIKTSSHSEVVPELNRGNERQKSLINVLADFSDDAPLNEQSLWTGEQQLNFRDDFLSGHPLSTRPSVVESDVNPVLHALNDTQFQQALLCSLSMTLGLVSPEVMAKKVELPARKFFQNKEKEWQSGCQKAFDELINSNAFKQQYLRCVRTCYEESCE